MSSTMVLYIGGMGRSGSTLLDRLLGEVPGCVPVGELVFLWQRGLQAGERCGCGEPLPSCPFWVEVGERAFGGWDRFDVEGAESLRRRLDRNRFVPSMLVPGLASRARRGAVEAYARIQASLYRAIAEVSGGRVIVDSSKHASTAALLRRVPGVDLRVVHLVRDPRGVAYSWSKVIPRPDVVDGEAEMARLGPTRIGARWDATAVMFEVLSLGRRSLRLRYEDVATDPAATLRRVVELTGSPGAGLDSLEATLRQGTTEFGVHHTVSGNPSRFRTGVIEISVDDAWRKEMPARDRRIVSTITWPLREAYGYGVIGDG